MLDLGEPDPLDKVFHRAGGRAGVARALVKVRWGMVLRGGAGLRGARLRGPWGGQKGRPVS